MKWSIPAEKLNPTDTLQVSLLQLLCSLEFAVTSAKWYVGEDAKRSDLPPHEHVLALAINIASIGETLHKFDHFVTKGIIQLSQSWDDAVKESWDYLKTDEVAELKRFNLKYVRDKSAFHIDPEPVRQFIQSLKQSDVVDVWEVEQNNNVRTFTTSGSHYR